MSGASRLGYPYRPCPGLFGSGGSTAGRVAVADSTPPSIARQTYQYILKFGVVLVTERVFGFGAGQAGDGLYIQGVYTVLQLDAGYNDYKMQLIASAAGCR